MIVVCKIYKSALDEMTPNFVICYTYVHTYVNAYIFARVS